MNIGHYSRYDVVYEKREGNGKLVMLGYAGLKEDYDYGYDVTYGIKIKSSEDRWLEFLKQVRQWIHENALLS